MRVCWQVCFNEHYVCVSQSVRTSEPPSLMLIDSCALLHWPLYEGVCAISWKTSWNKSLTSWEMPHVCTSGILQVPSLQKQEWNKRTSRGKQRIMEVHSYWNDVLLLPPQNATLSNDESKRQLWYSVYATMCLTNVCRMSPLRTVWLSPDEISHRFRHIEAIWLWELI